MDRPQGAPVPYDFVGVKTPLNTAVSDCIVGHLCLFHSVVARSEKQPVLRIDGFEAMLSSQTRHRFDVSGGYSTRKS